MREIPRAFLERMKALPDWDYSAFERALLEDAPQKGLRVNTLKISAADFAENAPFPLTPSPLCPEGYFIREEDRAGKHPFHAAGLYYLQEPSAQAVVTALEPQKNMKILDLCAAPGGKSGHAAARLSHTGLLIANECVPSRAKILSFNQERMGVRAGAVTSAMPDALADAAAGFFDAVLADVPCSGEGMFRREPKAAEEWSPEHADTCAVRGRKILMDAAKLVCPGGVLMFSTCTFNPAENEGAVEALLRAYPQFSVEEITSVTLPAGRPDWVNGWADAGADAGAGTSAEFGRGDGTGFNLGDGLGDGLRDGLRDDLGDGLRRGAGAREDLRRTARLMFYNAQGEGHFIAKLRKNDGETGISPRKPDLQALSKAELAAFRALWEDCFTEEPWGEPVKRGDEVFLMPEGLPALPGLLTPGVHAGTLIGERKGVRFEPSHTVFMAVPAGKIRRVCALEAEDERLERFFGGEGIETEVEKGYAAAAVYCGGQAYPVGFGKISGGILKNKLPKGLRR